MKEFNLGKFKTEHFEKYLILVLSEEWLAANDSNPVIFDAKLTKEGMLVLATRLTELAKTNGSDNNVM